MATATTTSSIRGPRRFLVVVAPPLVTFVLVFVFWEMSVRVFALPLYLLPAPLAILETFFAQPGYLLGIGLFTFMEALVGFAIGCTLGTLVAMLCVRWRRMASGLIPFSVAASAVPIVALSPLMGVWLGSTSSASKIGVVAVMTFFPTLVNVFRGLVSPGADEILLMHSYAAHQGDIFRKVRLPAAQPYLFNALKICTTLSMIGAVVAEFFGGPRNSLGVFIKTEAGILHTRAAWAAILVACLYGILFYLVVVAAERLVMPWHTTLRK